MTDGTATDRAYQTGAQRAADDLCLSVALISDEATKLRDDHSRALFDRVLAADTPCAYVQYVSGKLAAMIDALHTQLIGLTVYANAYAQEVERGQLDTAEDRRARVERMVVASTYTAAAEAGRDRFGAALDELESMLAARKAATDPVAATDDDDDDDPTDARVAAHEVAIASDPMAHELTDDERHAFGAGGVQ